MTFLWIWMKGLAKVAVFKHLAEDFDMVDDGKLICQLQENWIWIDSQTFQELEITSLVPQVTILRTLLLLSYINSPTMSCVYILMAQPVENTLNFYINQPYYDHLQHKMPLLLKSQWQNKQNWPEFSQILHLLHNYIAISNP